MRGDDEGTCVAHDAALGGDLQHFRPRHPRHVVVGDEKVVGGRGQQVEGFPAGSGGLDLEPRAAEGESHEVARVVVVLHQKEMKALGRGELGVIRGLRMEPHM